MPREPKAVGEIIASYTAEALPTEAIERMQRDVVSDLNTGEIAPKDALRLLNLLLTIALQKLQVVA